MGKKGCGGLKQQQRCCSRRNSKDTPVFGNDLLSMGAGNNEQQWSVIVAAVHWALLTLIDFADTLECEDLAQEILTPFVCSQASRAVHCLGCETRVHRTCS